MSTPTEPATPLTGAAHDATPASPTTPDTGTASAAQREVDSSASVTTATTTSDVDAAGAGASEQDGGTEAHLRMTQRRKAGFDKKQAAATKEKGLLIVNTGNGKGKSTAAFGMGLRVLGHGMRLGVVQFIKGALHTSERDLLQAYASCEFVTVGHGYTWNTQNRDDDIATAREGWDIARRMIESGDYQMVILDELNTVLKYDYLPLDEVLAVLQGRPEMLHVVVTGRHAADALVECADLVTEMRIVKHPYREQGVKAQRGVEF